MGIHLYLVNFHTFGTLLYTDGPPYCFWYWLMHARREPDWHFLKWQHSGKESKRVHLNLARCITNFGSAKKLFQNVCKFNFSKCKKGGLICSRTFFLPLFQGVGNASVNKFICHEGISSHFYLKEIKLDLRKSFGKSMRENVWISKNLCWKDPN